MTESVNSQIDNFLFRDLHPDVRFGTASDRYAGWIGQIYSEERYSGRVKRRSKRVGKLSFTEEVLPVECAKEYFEHFSVLEIDFTFYRPLTEKDGTASRNYHVLRQYLNHLGNDDRLILKVPQVVSARKLLRGGAYIRNESYLDPAIFIKHFYEPAVKLLGSSLGGFIFEQEYQRKQDRIPAEELASVLDDFFGAIPEDTRYHVELRTEAYLSDSVFEVFEKHGVGQVLSHWTWLPPLVEQFERSGSRFHNSGNEAIIRLMTPRGVKYAEAFARAFPFDKLVDELLQIRMVEEAAELLRRGVEQGEKMNLIINNRAGGNAPLIGHDIARRFSEAP